ncbi:diguanylate cyclase, partial [Klebsiella pneumoniae]|nr:diguanylate cyclase [Klebsiella pneumoniae]
MLDAAAERAVKAGQSATLAYVRVARYPSLLAEIGIAGVDLLLTDLANLLRAHFVGDAQLARYGDDVFGVLLQGQSPEQARDLLQGL